MSELVDEIKQTFDLEKLRLEAAKKLNTDEWPAFDKMRQEYEGQRRFAKRAYDLEYDERVAMARVRLINRAGAKDRHHTPRWLGYDRFDKNVINRQAHREVRHSFLKDLVRIDREEARDITQMIDASEHSRAMREKPRRDFERATDRRVDGDRRTPKQPRKRSIS